MASSPSVPSVWENKRRVEALYPEFPSLDISAQNFDVFRYGALVQDMLREAGIPIVPYAITWKDLNCMVPIEPPQRAIATVVSGVASAFSGLVNGCASMFPNHRHDKQDKPPPAHVLDDVSGYLKPGQLCLVLGSSGSGTSILLSRIAGRHMPRLVHTSGEVLYQGETRLAGVARPEHIVHYIPQEDTHIPQLTVRHTFEFAAACKWPAWVPHVNVLRQNDVILTARLLGIERTLDTIVGSNILRGVSGGERKRVTIGEMAIGIVGGALVMDNWSKGLDSATTLSITSSMRRFADDLQGSAIVCMQAPGTEVYNLFDTLCLLHEGRLVYFGPAKQAERYFNSLGFYRPLNRSLPDFVSTIFDQNLRDDYVASTNSDDTEPIPVTAEQFAECFKKSEYFSDLNRSIDDVNNEPHVVVPPGSENLAKLGQQSTLHAPRFQIAAMMRRQKNWLFSIRKNVVRDIVQNLVFGIILGSIFWQLPDTQGGANSRGGVVFLAILFIGLGSLGKVMDRYEEKVVFTKQNSAAFFNAWTYLLTQAFFDFFIELAKAAAMLVPLYIMAGLNIGSSAQRLLYAVLIGTFTSLFMISFTRFWVAVIDDPNAAQGLAGFFTILMVLFAGYMKSSDDLQDWLVWIYWIDPFHYALEALLLNEFEGLTLSCATEELLPRDANVPLDLRICPVSSGISYLSDFRGINNDEIFRLYYFIVVIAFTVLFFVLSGIATSHSRSRGHSHKLAFAGPDSGSSHHSVTVNVSEADAEVPRTSFTFSKMSYSVEDGSSSKMLLSDVTGNAVGGKVVLLMGESGAGKTTLLDVCAMRKTLKHGASVEGEVRLNGRLLTKKELSYSSGYCEQNDMHVGEATVFEAIMFSATLRLPRSMSADEKMTRTQDTLTMLGLEPYSSVLVKSLGSGELKLLTMALEVVADPKVLFLDEPTSGISSSSAITVAKALRKIAGSGTAVVCTVHQPSAEVFSMFDRLLLLKRGGKTVYFGDIGPNADTLRTYFEERGGAPMATDQNPAVWMLDVIGDAAVDWHEKWNESEERRRTDEETQSLVTDDEDGEENVMEEKQTAFDRPNVTTQVVQVIRRQFWRYWRLPEYNVTRVLLNLMIALLVGLLFLREIDDSQTGANLAFAALFLSIIPASLAAANVIPTTVEGRSVFYRETASGTYKPVAHHVAVGVVELPFTVFSTTIFSLVFYFLVGLDSGSFFYFFLAIQLLYVMAVMFGIMLSSILPDAATAANMENVIFSVFQVVSGFFITKPQLRPWWKWTTWINPFSYYLSGIIQNQMAGREFICTPPELAQFQFKSNVSCESAFGDMYQTVRVSGRQFCEFCPTPNGEAIIEQFAADEVNKWVSLVAIFAVILFFRIVAGFGFAKLRFMTR